MVSVTICGHFGGNNNFLDGQTVKTKNLYKALTDKYGFNEVKKLDTYNWKKRPIKLLKECINAAKNSKNIIILPAHNGIKVFVPLFTYLKKKYKFNLIYAVVGGWLPVYINNKPKLSKKLKLIDEILVETKKMKKDLINLGFSNVDILLNFKIILPLSIDKINYNFQKPYPVCTFSRVMKEKGIVDVIEIIKNINKDEIIYTLDIYGPVSNEFKEEFETLKSEFPEYIKYKGCVDSNNSIEVISKYYLLLFPTRFETEGIPGTIIDALFSGVPVIATKWENATDIIIDNQTGFLVDMYDLEKFKNKMIECLDLKKIKVIKKNALLKANDYISTNAIKGLTKYLK